MRIDFPDLGRLRAERADLPPPGRDLLCRIGAFRRVALLDSATGGRFTVVAASPWALLRWNRGAGEIALPGGARAREADFATLLRGALAATALPTRAPLPFGPGWIGYFGYGLRTAFENVPVRWPATEFPDVTLGYYPAVAVHDAERSEWWFLYREHAADAVRTLRACLARTTDAPRGRVVGAARASIRRADYLAAVERAVSYVHAGDVFQVNFAHEFRARFEGDPLALYLALRESNPAPYAAYLDLGSARSVHSTSPELFLSLRGRDVVTRPIKGTRPRGATGAEDRRLGNELRDSEKDTAELAMIVDLERNDLGRVCEPGTVVVTEAFSIEAYASVWHRVAEVSGTLEEGSDRVDLLAATFPGGSITGAPKVRAMEIIDELEAAARGPYTGSIGILADDGGMELNIAIRTPVLCRGEVSVWVGGGIVADSDPAAEYEETLAKGKAIFAALDL